LHYPSQTKNYFNALTGVRAVAAYMVFLHHADQNNNLHLPFIMHKIFMEFHTGVTIFFVLSGFLITYRYYDNSVCGRPWLKQYFLNRAARIYPMYIILTLLTFFIYSLQGQSTDPFILFANLSFLKGFFSDLKFSGIAQGWSLTVEECFYCIAPLIFFLYNRKLKLFIMPFILLLSGFLLVAFFNGDSNNGFMHDNQFMLLYTFFGRCFEFFTGIYLAFYIKNYTNTVHKRKETKTALGIIVSCLSILAMVFIAVNFKIKFSVNSYAGLFINNIILPIAIAVFFAGLITENSFIKKILASATFQLLGKSSYIFYLIHMGVISAWFAGFIRYENSWLNTCILFILLNIVSIILYKTIEEPANRFIRNIFSPVKISPSVT
jgi:peptidoglycan/LPS O-acetylase OafA/YrhL